VQADRGLNYDTLQKVMYTSMMAGYSDVKLAVLAK
jgi:biopolymer transport protein ExbD